MRGLRLSLLQLISALAQENFKAVVRLCDRLQTMLWVALGSRGEDLYMNLMAAVGRCLEGEMRHLGLQSLNLDGSDRPTLDVLAHHLFRLHMSQTCSGSKKAGEYLFTLQPPGDSPEWHSADSAISTYQRHPYCPSSHKRPITRDVDHPAQSSS